MGDKGLDKEREVGHIFIVAFYMLRPASVPDHSDDVRDTRTGCCRHHLLNTVQNVTANTASSRSRADPHPVLVQRH